MLFNLNDYVKVKLTRTGKEILFKIVLQQKYPEASCYRNFILPEEDSNGWSNWQLWELMNIFGSHMANGTLPPFEFDIKIHE